MDRFCLFSSLKCWEKTLVFLGTLMFMYFIALFASLFFSWLGLFVFCSIWLKDVRVRFDRIDRLCKDKKECEENEECEEA